MYLKTTLATTFSCLALNSTGLGLGALYKFCSHGQYGIKNGLGPTKLTFQTSPEYILVIDRILWGASEPQGGSASKFSRS